MFQTIIILFERQLSENISGDLSYRAKSLRVRISPRIVCERGVGVTGVWASAGRKIFLGPVRRPRLARRFIANFLAAFSVVWRRNPLTPANWFLYIVIVSAGKRVYLYLLVSV